MRQGQIFMILLSVALLTAAGSSAASECSGNACDDVTATWDGTCHLFTNHGTKRIKVRVGQNTSFELQRGQTHRYVWIDGQCTVQRPANFTANYVNP